MKKLNSKTLKFFILIIAIPYLAGCKKNEPEATTLTDKDGNIYNIITIGTQTWMKENLKTTKYNDGSAIPNLTSGDDWSGSGTGAYCWYNNDPNIYKDTYGALYNWYAVNTGKLCPAGWHVPVKNEWINLTFHEEGYLIAGGRLKEADTTHWKSPDGQSNSTATNESGFTALPGGWRSSSTFYALRENGNWWSSTSDNSTYSWGFSLYNFTDQTSSDSFINTFGFSVRCIRDASN